MKHILTILCVMSLLIGMVPLMMPVTASAETLTTQTQNMTQMEGYYKAQGRIERIDDVLCMDTSTSGFEFYYYGKGAITLNLHITSVGGSTFFSTIIDGVETRTRVATSAGVYTNTSVTIATSLAEGYHHVEFYKQNGAMKSRVHVDDVTFTGRLLPAPEEDPVILEVVGDSIMGGTDVYYDSVNFPGESGYDTHQNGLESYGYKTGALIGANTRVVQASGYGLVAGWNGDTTTNIPKIYPAADYFRYPNRAYNFDPPADIVVIDLGTNDNAGGVALSTFESAAKTFMQTVRSYNPGCQVVWCTGTRGTFYKTEVTAAISELGGASNGYYFCELPYGRSAGGHPNADEHTAAAQVLSAFLQENCLSEGYATIGTTASLQAKINAANSAPFTSGALTAAVASAEMELAVGTTDPYRLGSRLQAIEDAMNGKTAGDTIMPNANSSTYAMFDDDDYVAPTYNADGTVKLTKKGAGTYWPTVETSCSVAWNAKATPYLRFDLQGTASWNAVLFYQDASGTERNLKVSSEDGNGDNDYAAPTSRKTVTVDMGSTVIASGHANSEGVVRVTMLKLFVVGAQNVYLNVYDCSFTEESGATWSGASDAAAYISSANVVYVRDNGANLSGAVPSGAKVMVASGVNTITLNGLTMSGATPAFTVKSNVTVKLVGTNTVTASTQFSGGTATYIGTGVLKNGSTVVMCKGDVNGTDTTTADDIRAMMTYLAGLTTLNSTNVKRADTDGDGTIDTRDVRRYLDTVVSA